MILYHNKIRIVKVKYLLIKILKMGKKVWIISVSIHKIIIFIKKVYIKHRISLEWISLKLNLKKHPFKTLQKGIKKFINNM